MVARQVGAAGGEDVDIDQEAVNHHHHDFAAPAGAWPRGDVEARCAEGGGEQPFIGFGMDFHAAGVDDVVMAAEPAEVARREELDNVVCDHPANAHCGDVDDEAAAGVSGKAHAGHGREAVGADAAEGHMAACFGHAIGCPCADAEAGYARVKGGREFAAADEQIVDPAEPRVVKQGLDLGRHNWEQGHPTLPLKRPEILQRRGGGPDHAEPRTTDERPHNHHLARDIVSRQGAHHHRPAVDAEKSACGPGRHDHVALEQPDLLGDAGGA